MVKHKKELTQFQKRLEIFRRISKVVLNLRENKLYILRRRAQPHDEMIIMPTELDKQYLYYIEYACSDEERMGGMIRLGHRKSINSLQFWDVIPWTKKYAPLTVNYKWMSDEYKKRAFN